MRTVYYVFIYLVLLSQFSFGFVASCVGVVKYFDDVYRASSSNLIGKATKIEFVELVISNPSLLKSFSAMTKDEKIKIYLGIAVEKQLLKPSKQLLYIERFKKLKGGDSRLLKAIREKKNLDELSQVLKVGHLEKIKPNMLSSKKDENIVDLLFLAKKENR